MPKEHHHPKGEGVKMLGTPDELVNLLLSDKADKTYVLNQLINEGPKHKQVLSALLLKRLYQVVKNNEKLSNVPFSLQDGYWFGKKNQEEEHWLPITLPINTAPKLNTQKIADAAAAAPEHELLVYSICLQVIEWLLSTTASRKTNAH